MSDNEAEKTLIDEQPVSANAGPFATVTPTQPKHSKKEDIYHLRDWVQYRNVKNLHFLHRLAPYSPNQLGHVTEGEKHLTKV